MQRLVYAPKVYVYIQTPAETINISDLVVSGNVNRKLNTVSTAEVTFQNPYRQFTKPGNSTFSPMDKITIFLQRLPGMPVQVFTGYLDSVPYYQMYPGTCTVTATCSLKRLQYTYFDPGLPFMIHFMASYGWLINPDGSMQSPNSATAGSGTVGDVQVYGDSLAVGTADGLKDSMKATTDAKEGISSTDGLKKIQANLDKLGDQLVISLGTNDPDDAKLKANAEKVMSIANGRPVYWVNIARKPMSGWDADTAMNTALSQVAAKHSNMHIIDWKSTVTSESIPLGDGIHPNADGYKKRSNLIHDAVVKGVTTTQGNTSQTVPQPLTADEIQTASMSDLAFACLKHIAHWDPNHLYIEQLPDGLISRIQYIFNSLQASNAEVTAEFNEWLKQFIGTGSAGNGAGSSADAEQAGNDASGVPYADLITKYAKEYKFDPALIAAIIERESNFQPGATGHDPGGTIGQGLMQLTSEGYKEWIRGYIADGEGPIEANIHAGCRALREKVEATGDLWSGVRAYNGSGSAAEEYMNDIKNVRYPKFQKKFKNSDSDGSTSTSNTTTEDTSSNSNTTADSSTTTKTGSRGDSADANDGALHPPVKNIDDFKPSDVQKYGNNRGDHIHSGVDISPVPLGTQMYAVCKAEVVYAGSWGNEGQLITLKAKVDVPGYPKNFLIGYGHASSVSVKQGDNVNAGTPIGKSGAGANGQPHIHFWVNDASGNVAGDGKGDSSMDPEPLAHAAFKGEATTDAGTTADSDQGATGTGTAVDALVAARTASVFSQLNFPEAIDQATAILLTGGKSYMNDQPLLPFIEQIIKGTMRSFQSLPNGDFFAFYPDYFGTMGTAPYWEIDDIEVLEGNINLTDEALATHVYVVGSTMPDMGTTEPLLKLQSTGVVNILNAGTSDFLNLTPTPKTTVDGNTFTKKNIPNVIDDTENELSDEDTSQPFLGDYQQAVTFLQRYGVRPFVQDAPMIRSHVFETFYAYQQFMLLWARQFMTTFSFTFMPELYPGGLVAFPKHGIQMFIDEVHHSFDYSGGFTTQANLSAPSSLNKNAHPEISRGMVRGW